ncbi:hypothetical protein Csa_012668 [Cucumis sativus]|nr:hypothetical protein Csa_012668 [Cucumis sativus]
MDSFYIPKDNPSKPIGEEAQEFNCPYKLGKEPGLNEPMDAMWRNVTVMAGDIVVVGTDGLTDNIFAGEFGRSIGRGCRKQIDVPLQTTWMTCVTCAW